MTYRYTYDEKWVPKDIDVTFRMYQINLDGSDTEFGGYGETHTEDLLQMEASSFSVRVEILFVRCVCGGRPLVAPTEVVSVIPENIAQHKSRAYSAKSLQSDRTKYRRVPHSGRAKTSQSRTTLVGATIGCPLRRHTRGKRLTV